MSWIAQEVVVWTFETAILKRDEGLRFGKQAEKMEESGDFCLRS